MWENEKVLERRLKKKVPARWLPKSVVSYKPNEKNV